MHYRYSLVIVYLFWALLASGQFTAPQTLIQGNPNAIRSCFVDLDLDGDLDILTGGNNLRYVFFYENVGSGIYNTRDTIIELPVAQYDLKNIYSEDYDNDGDLDIGIVFGQIGVRLYENNGQLDYNMAHLAYNNSNTYWHQNGIVFADLDNDGLKDLIYLTNGNGRWDKNLGNFQFSYQQACFEGGYVLVEDVNNDGYNDILEGNTNNFCVNLSNAGDLPVSQVVCYGNNISWADETGILTLDYDADGDVDVIKYGETGQLEVYFNDSLGGFSTSQVIFSAGNGEIINRLELLDINYDGIDDLVFCTFDAGGIPFPGAIRCMPGTGSSFQPAYTLYTGSVGRGVMDFADIDLDGQYEMMLFPDSTDFVQKLIIFNQDSLLLFNDSLSTEVDRFAGIWGFEAKFADFDLDGDMDIYCPPIVHLNEGDDKLFYGVQIESSAAVNDYEIADMNYDGFPDIIGVENGQIHWIQNYGNGTFSQRIIVASGNSINQLGIHDAEGDGDLDILYDTYNGSHILRVVPLTSPGVFGSTYGYFETPFSTANLTEIGDIQVAEYDTIPYNINVAVKSGNSNKIALKLFNQYQLTTITGFSNIKQIRIMDVDNDGFRDIVFNNPMIRWFKNEANGSFTNQGVIDSLGGILFTIDDINQDGYDDIIYVNTGTNPSSIYWLQNLGNGTFSSQIFVPTVPFGAGNVSLLTADFGNDQDPDIIYNVQGAVARLFIGVNQTYGQTILSGRVYNDVNQNQTFDANDYGLPNIAVQVSTGYTVFTDSAGYYNVYTQPGSYVVSCQLGMNWSLTTDSLSYSVISNEFIAEIDSLDFGFTASVLIDTVTNDIVGNVPKCNDTTKYWLNVQNEGSTVSNGIITFTMDSLMSYYSSIPAPDSVVNFNIYWAYDSLLPLQLESLELFLLTPDSINTLNCLLEAQVLDSLGNVVFQTLDSISQQVNCDNQQFVKEVSPTGFTQNGFVPNSIDSLEFTIQYENLGTDTIYINGIIDELSQFLDPSSVILLSSSHPVQIYTQGNILNINFQNLMLPPSQININESSIYLKFRIDLLPNLLIGSQIFNDAKISFGLSPQYASEYIEFSNSTLNTIYNCDDLTNFTGTDVCIGDSSTISSTAQFLDSISWYYNGVWASDSSYYEFISQGLLDTISVSATNFYCQLDTILDINILGATSMSTQTMTMCDSYYWTETGLSYNSSGIYDVNLQSVSGCDSIITLDLTIVNSNSSIDIVTTCDSLTWIDGNTYTASTNTPTWTLTNVAGCDSVVTLDLTIANSTSADVITACDSYTWIDGITYSSSTNTPTWILTNQAGCDSVITLDLTINTANASAIQIDDTTLQANIAGAQYQWLDCDNNFAILNGEIDQLYYATSNGNYAVEVTDNGCIDTSACLPITTIGIIESEIENLIVSPNPTDGKIAINLGKSFDNVSLKIYDAAGRFVQEQYLKNISKTNLLIDQPPGPYTLEIIADTKRAVVRIVKQ